MPTTYTSLLGLALPATGELSGTWGSTVNTEITSLLDSAIAGTTTLNTDADVTLTTTTGAANQARQAIILWTANGTVTRNITAPAASKTYVVINASAGTQSIVFRGVGPTAGVTVVKGESAVVAWNGSDFIKISNTSGAGAFTNLSVSGTTTLSGLTASTALALDASKNVVSVTNTGTGNNVLATSPVLTTPNLGTPSAIVLTNASGTASININGTVGATTPNTGAFTTLSASGVATFSAGTAAAPALTTIGDTDTGVWFPAANTWAVATGASERMRITSAGNVVVGSTATIGGNMSVWGGLYLAANDSSAELQNYRASDNSGAAFQYLNKARGTIASPTVVQNGDGLGSQIWRGYDGASYVQAAIIRAEVDGVPGSGDMPGRLVFATTLDGASTVTERLRLKNGGQLRFVPLAADPAGAEAGDVYYNSGTNKLRVYNGTAWVDLH